MGSRDRRGRRRGQELRRARPHNQPVAAVSAGWFARHPTDHFLAKSLRGITDQRCRSLITAQIDRLAAVYEQIRDLDWSRHEDAADGVVEVQVSDARMGSWTQPVPVRVTDVVKGVAEVGRELGVRLVADPAAKFNGIWVGIVTGERWRICATNYPDGTPLPTDGTRRLAPR